MTIMPEFEKKHADIMKWRQHIHAHPELLFETKKTANFIIEKLREFNVDDIVTDLAQNSVVAVIKGKGNNRKKTIALRADMDALPISEQTDKPYQSQHEGKMHACGHDGHSAMLLGAADYLSQSRNFDGTVILVFQPAEEGGGGGRVMVNQGLIEKFQIDEIYGMHNWPGMDVGKFGIRKGALMAATNTFDITITGKGGHAAMPSQTIDPIVVASQLVLSLQTVISRNIDPVDNAVLSITKFNAGTAYNIIPEYVTMSGTIRTLSDNIRDKIINRMKQICAGYQQTYDCHVDNNFHGGYPVTYNHDSQTDFAADIAAKIVGEDSVNKNAPPSLGGEDFAYMLQACPGAFIFLGQGDSKGLHHPEYDFNDEIIPIGCSYWAKLVETAMPLGKQL